LEEFMNQVARDVPDPVSGKPVLENMRPRGSGQNSRAARRPPEDPPDDNQFHLAALGSGSDYTPFLQHLGVASLNLGFGGEAGGGVYHSNYDDFAWYSRFSDPDFVYGKALAQVMSTALLRLSSAPVLPFEFGRFAATVGRYVDEVEKVDKQKEKINLSDVRLEMEKLKKLAAAYELAYS